MVRWLGLRTPDAGPWAHPCSGDGVPHAVLKTPCATAKTRHPAWGFPEGPPAMPGDTGLVPGLAGSHMPQGDPAHEPQLLSLSAQSLCPMTREATDVKSPHMGLEGSPGLGGEALTQR